MAKAPIISPLIAGTRYFCFSSSLPHSKIVWVAVEACIDTVAENPMQARANSSVKMV